MRPEDIKLSPKIEYILTTPSRYLLLEGPSGVGKTFPGGLRTFFKIFESPASEKQYAFVAESISTAEKFLIDDQASFYNIFKPVCKYRGGSKPSITIQGRYGEKILYLAGYNNKVSMRKILGLNLRGIHIEEISEADDDFVREAFVRASRLEDPVWVNATTNGALDTKIFYKEFFDKSYINWKYNSNLPAQTLAYMNETPEKDRDFEYIYVGFDDSMTQSQETIDRLSRAFPVGSFFYNSKYLGIRGNPSGAVYAEYMDESKHIVPYSKVFDKFNFVKFSIGVDVGHSDYTVFTLVGFTNNFEYNVAIDYFKLNKSSTDTMWLEFTKWYDKYYHMHDVHNKMHGVFFDPAGGGAIVKQTLQGKLLYKYNLQSGNAYKKTIMDRIQYNLMLINADKLIFTDKTRDIYNAFKSVVYAKDKTKTDPRVWGQHINKDLVDSFEYGQSPFMSITMRRS